MARRKYRHKHKWQYGSRKYGGIREAAAWRGGNQRMRILALAHRALLCATHALAHGVAYQALIMASSCIIRHNAHSKCHRARNRQHQRRQRIRHRMRAARISSSAWHAGMAPARVRVGVAHAYHHRSRRIIMAIIANAHVSRGALIMVMARVAHAHASSRTVA